MWAAATPTWAEAVRAACKWRFTSPSRFKWGFQDGPRVHPYSIFELSVNTTSGAPSFVRSLRKGWESTDIHRNCQHPGRKRSRDLSQMLRAPSLRLFPWQGAGDYDPPTPVSRSPARNREKGQRLERLPS